MLENDAFLSDISHLILHRRQIFLSALDCRLTFQNVNFDSGMSKIQEWTKESMKTKPFCLAVSKDWTEQPGKLDLREIYTKLVWKKKQRKACMVEQEDLKDITKILSEEKLEDKGPVRILVQGNL